MDKRTVALATVAVLTAALLAVGCSKAPAVAGDPPAAPAAVANVSDIDVTEHVKTALHQNDLLKGFDISVVTLKGDVRLTAVLDTQAQIDEAMRITRAADGVHSVHDELTLKP